MRTSLYFTLCFLSFTMNVLSQNQSIELDPVTISATLSPQQASKTGRNITVITQETIQKLPVNSVDEIIRYLPGIEVQSRGPMGAQSNITIRGGTFQQVLIILDGIRLNDPLTGHFNSYIPITPDEIERIEILKGPAAVLYGTEAVGGVVHIISKTFQEKNRKDGHRFMAQLTTGEFGLTNGQASASFQKNKTTGSLSLLTNNAGGQPLRGTNGFFNLTTLTGSLKQSVGKSFSVAYRFGLDDRNFNAQNFYSSLLIDTATEYVASTWNHVKTTFTRNKHAVTLDLGDKRTLDEFQLNKSRNPNINNSRLQQAQLTYQYRITENTTLSIGSQYIRRSITSNDRGDHAIRNAAGFAFLQTTLFKKFNLLPGIRTEWNERSGWAILPQLNLSYPHQKFLFRAAAGRTAREADFTERFNNYRRMNVPSGSRVGNPELIAETAMSYEAGADYSLNNELKISATVFGRNHADLIDWVRTPYANMPRRVNLVSAASYDLASNIAQVQTIGTEMDVHYSKSFGNHKVQAGLGAIWMESKSSDTTPSLYVSNHAKWLINLYATYRYKVFGFSVNGLYKERSFLPPARGLVPLSPSYFLINAKADLQLLKGKMILFVQADNLLNQSYSDILGSVMPNRWWMGGIKLTMD